MKVFISWSGELSKRVAEALNEWLPQVIQSVKTFYSPEIQKGKRWQEKISLELQDCNFGIICLTTNNLHEDWILFEAGALSKIVSESNVATFLINLKPSDVTEPLSIFQATEFERGDVLKLVKAINSQISNARLESEILTKVFDKWWPELEEKIGKALKVKVVKQIESPKRTEAEKLDELIQISRGLQKDITYVLQLSEGIISKHLNSEKEVNVLNTKLKQSRDAEIVNMFEAIAELSKKDKTLIDTVAEFSTKKKNK